MALAIRRSHVAMINPDQPPSSERRSHAERLGAKVELFASTMRIGIRACYGWLHASLRKMFRASEQPGGLSGLPVRIGIDTEDLLHRNGGQTQEEPVLDALNHESFAPPKRSESVLLVDDEAAVRGHMATMLRELGYTVCEAADGMDALRIVQEHRGQDPDLLLTDMVMPQMGGRELGYRVGLLRPEIKVLFCSSYPEVLAIRNGMIDERTPYVQKPVSRDTLALKVRQLFDQATPDVHEESPTAEQPDAAPVNPSVSPVESRTVPAVEP
jgi:CheY-like chemotaxis protein